MRNNIASGRMKENLVAMENYGGPINSDAEKKILNDSEWYKVTMQYGELRRTME